MTKDVLPEIVYSIESNMPLHEDEVSYLRGVAPCLSIISIGKQHAPHVLVRLLLVGNHLRPPAI